ncbi:MAG TPA: aminoglycoside adenylyltransferase domain-containing protein [Ktedonobacterales bacterium]
MPHYHWATCPPATRNQGEMLVAEIQHMLGDALTGIYLHGSLAMGCFNPARSDLDVLVVTKRSMTLNEKRASAEMLLCISAHPHPIEISFLSLDDLSPWRYPTPYQFHYSEDWRERQIVSLANGDWLRWNDTQPTDADLAAHFTVTRARGICLVGQPIAEALPIVPPSDYRASILADVEDFTTGRIAPATNTVYFVLNACRVLAYLQEGHIFSKEEGGEWALAHLSSEFHRLIAQALAAYREDGQEQIDGAALGQFVAYVDGRLKQR